MGELYLYLYVNNISVGIMETETINAGQKAHRKRQAGSKLDKKKKKAPSDPNLTARQRNPKAFAYHSVNKVAREVRRFVVCCCFVSLCICILFHVSFYAQLPVNKHLNNKLILLLQW